MTSVLTEPKGLRTDAFRVLESIASDTGALFGFVCREVAESETLSVLASVGIDATAFRRLEARASSSALIRVLEHPEKLDLLLHDEPSLDFLAIDNKVVELNCVPIRRGRSSVGLVALAFDKRNAGDRHEVAVLMTIAASFVAQAMQNDDNASLSTQLLDEAHLNLKQELKDRYDLSNLIGSSGPMRSVYDQVAQIARSNSSVLLRGESGTGKELIANVIHYNSLRAKRPFINLNCTALPGSLIEAEMFGTERDTFAAADQAKKGAFELADGGTIFIDEIGDLPILAQAKLFRILHEREFERLGGSNAVRSNVRLIAATGLDLESRVASGELREDLFYKLNVFTIFLPPLRDRKADILLLADFFLDKYNREHDRRIGRISTPAIDMLTAYHFPGNVRELENVIERAVLVCDANVIHGHHLPPTLQTADGSDTTAAATLDNAVGAFEKDLIQDALKSTRGNIARAARDLGSTERILGYKIKNYGIEPSRFK